MYVLGGQYRSPGKTYTIKSHYRLWHAEKFNVSICVCACAYIRACACMRTRVCMSVPLCGLVKYVCVCVHPQRPQW